MTVGCQCGTKLRVAEESAGQKVRCPRCRRGVAVPAGEDDGFRILSMKGDSGILFGSPEFHQLIARPRGAARVRRTTIPWEVWGIVILLGISFIENLFGLLLGPMRGGSAVGLMLGAILIYGIVQRANWAWWLCLIGAFLGLLISGVVLLTPQLMSKAKVAEWMVWVGLLRCGALAVLLFIARLR